MRSTIGQLSATATLLFCCQLLFCVAVDANFERESSCRTIDPTAAIQVFMVILAISVRQAVSDDDESPVYNNRHWATVKARLTMTCVTGIAAACHLRSGNAAANCLDN